MKCLFVKKKKKIPNYLMFVNKREMEGYILTRNQASFWMMELWS